jgi:hypothetical protein
LRAYALLVPENIDAQLAVLDAQLDESQWPAAADSLQALSARLGETSPALAWRRARWQAAMQPAQAARGHAQAVERAIAAKDTDSLRRARLAQAEWLLHSSQLGDAEAVLSALDGGDPEAQLLRAQWALERGELATARSEYIAAQLGFESRGLQGESRRSRLGLVEAALRGGDPAAAIVQAEALIEESEAQGDTRLQVDVLDALGRARTGLGQFEAAAEDFQGAIALAREQGDAHRQAKLRYHLGNAYAQERKRPQEAEQSYRLAAEAFHALRDPIWEIKALANLALMAERGGRRLDARAAYRDALARVRELGNPRELGRISFNAGVNARELGQLAAAAAHFEEAMVALGQAGATDVQVVTAAARADLACLQGDAATARRVLDATAELRTRSAPLPQSAWLTADARWQELAGEAALASARLHEAEALREQAGIRAAQLDLELRQLRLGLLDAATARAARLPLERIEAELQRLGEPKYALVASLAAVEAALAEGDRERARALADALRAPVDARGNRAQRLQLDWLLALAGETDLRDGRLAQLNADARADGFLLLAQLAERERLAPGSEERKARDAQLLEQGLAGATRSAAAAF